ncbi:MAG: beta-xylosidase, partial [Bacteroidota bacterium]
FQDSAGKWWATAFFNANQAPLAPDQAKNSDLSQTAYTINAQGLTLVPMEIKLVEGQVIVRALDPAYAVPGQEEVQDF